MNLIPQDVKSTGDKIALYLMFLNAVHCYSIFTKQFLFSFRRYWTTSLEIMISVNAKWFSDGRSFDLEMRASVVMRCKLEIQCSRFSVADCSTFLKSKMKGTKIKLKPHWTLHLWAAFCPSSANWFRETWLEKRPKIRKFTFYWSLCGVFQLFHLWVILTLT